MELTPRQEQVLHLLLDKYEGRSDYSAPNKNSRRTMQTIDKKKYPDYYHVSDSRFRIAFNQDMESLENKGLIDLVWLKFDRGNTINRIILREDNIAEIYKLLNRVSKQEEYHQLAVLFSAWLTKVPSILTPFFEDMLAKINELSTLPARVKQDSLQDYEDLFKGLTAFVTPRPQEVLKRQLSVLTYNNSKRWEELEKSILWVIRHYCLEPEEGDLEDADLLSEYNILQNPNHLNLAGPLTFATTRGRIDVTTFYPDLGLSPAMVQELQIETCHAHAIVTIENLTSFYQYVYNGPAHHVVIYLGGYHNRPRRLILKKIFDFSKEHNLSIPFYHWGDMDLGGFRIWNHLCEKTGIPIKPLLMDEETYLAHINQGQLMDQTYMNHLADLLSNPSYEPLHPLIQLMLEKGVRVEQEAVSVSIMYT